MKALSARQPWAWLIVNGYKDVENRTWVTQHRGPLVIHAGAKRDSGLVDFAERRYRVTIARDELEYGGIVGTANLTDVVTSHRSKWFDGSGYGWVLENPRKTKFVSCPGRLRLFDVDAKLVRPIR